jgi:hypothetical protein
LIAAVFAGPQVATPAEEHQCDIAQAPPAKAPAKSTAAKGTAAKSTAAKAPAKAPASAQAVPDKEPPAGTPAARAKLLQQKYGKSGPQPRQLVTLRGEVVDYYCYIEKGATGPGHRDCGVKCVAGDVCMGLLTTDGRLMMISVNHMRAMEPLAWRGIPDPFNTCRGLIAETVDLTGYFMERKGQRIIEIMGVKPVTKTASAGR